MPAFNSIYMKTNLFTSHEESFNFLQFCLESYHKSSGVYFEELCKRTVVKNLLKGEILVADGQICDYYYFFVEGFCFSYYTKDGKECIMDFFQKSDFATIYHSFWDRTCSCFTVKTSENSTVLMVKYSDFIWLLEHYPTFSELMFLLLIRRLMSEEVRRYVIHCYMAEERILHFVKTKEIQEFMQHIPQYRIASWLNMAPETFAKLWGQIDFFEGR